MALSDGQVIGLWLDIASAALFMALGAFVAFVRPRRLLNISFALFAILFGLSLILINIGPEYFDLLGPEWTNLQTAVNVVWGCALVLVGLRFPTPIRRRERSTWVAASVIAGALMVIQVTAIPFSLDGAGTILQELTGLPAILYAYSDALAYVAFAFFLLLLALRAARRTTAPSNGFAGKAATATVALVPYNGLLFGALGIQALTGTVLNAWQTLSFLAILPITGGIWFVASLRSGGADRRRALVAALASLLFPVLGAVVALVWPDSFYTSGVLGATRLFGIGVLAYAVLRQQLFDIDVRLKTSLRHAFLGGFFLAVFLIVEQVVQAFSSDQLGLWAGSIVTALMLVSLSPLQRLSRRLADRAMPTVHDREPAYLDERKQAIYRDAYATVWEDGSVTRKEMSFLFRMRDSLGLTAEQCASIEADWNAAMRGDAPAKRVAPAVRAVRKPRARHS